MELKEIESALDSGQLYIRKAYGNLWKVRRNGETKLWKRQPGIFRIPIKFGFKSYGEINDTTLIGLPDDTEALIVFQENPK